MANQKKQNISTLDGELLIQQHKVSSLPNGLLVRVIGILAASNIVVFENTFIKIVENGFKYIILDCADLSHISSAGIGELTIIMKRLHKQHGGMVLINVTPQMHEIFELLGFKDYFVIKNSPDEAVIHFRPALNPDSNSLFPLFFRCPLCAKQLKAMDSGRFRCGICKALLDIEEDGQVFPA